MSRWQRARRFVARNRFRVGLLLAAALIAGGVPPKVATVASDLVTAYVAEMPTESPAAAPEALP